MKQIHECVRKEYGSYPEKVLQFGEGNFLRAFADWMVDLANERGDYHGSIVICQPIDHGMADRLNAQDCVYTVVMQGLENGQPVMRERVVTSVSRCIDPYRDPDALLRIAENPDLEVIISNTTEAGITYHAGDDLADRPQVSYPAKLCAFLYHRYCTFGGDNTKGVLILPVELIDDNGHKLNRIVRQYAEEWQLPDDFLRWLSEACEFCSTLVDRIVTGYPRDNIAAYEERLGYRDDMLVTCEPFDLWVIEGDERWKDRFPIHRGEAHVLWTGDVKPYKKRKVRILNGSHSDVIPMTYLSGYETVLSFFEGSVFGEFEREMIAREIIPVVDLPKEDLISFAEAVKERFRNPHLKHYLLDITLNQFSKFVARCLPTMQEYYMLTGHPAPMFSMGLAGMILFYRIRREADGWYGTRENGQTYRVRDDEAVLSLFADWWQSNDPVFVVHEALNSTALWGEALPSAMNGLEALVAEDLASMLRNGIGNTVRDALLK